MGGMADLSKSMGAMKLDMPIKLESPSNPFDMFGTRELTVPPSRGTTDVSTHLC